MTSAQIIKINFLVLGLGLTLYITHQLNSRGLDSNFLALFGLAPAAPRAERVARISSASSADSVFTWNWCETRVAGLIKPDDFKLAQEGNTWVFESTVKQAVNFLSVEKWLARFCTVTARRSETKPDDFYKPALMVKFVDGHVEVLRRSDEGDYLWRGQAISSPEFDKALSELKNLPTAGIRK